MIFHRKMMFCRVKLDSVIIAEHQNEVTQIIINDISFIPTKCNNACKLSTDFFEGKSIECKKIFNSEDYTETKQFEIRYENDKEGREWIHIKRA